MIKPVHPETTHRENQPAIFKLKLRSGDLQEEIKDLVDSLSFQNGVYPAEPKEASETNGAYSLDFSY